MPYIAKYRVFNKLKIAESHANQGCKFWVKKKSLFLGSKRKVGLLYENK